MVVESSCVLPFSANEIWTVLTDAPAYSAWNPTVNYIKGTIAAEQEIVVNPKAMNRDLILKVTEFTQNASMTWKGELAFGLMKFVRSYQLVEKGLNETAFLQKEEASGLLVTLMKPFLPDFRPLMSSFNEGLLAELNARFSSKKGA